MKIVDLRCGRTFEGELVAKIPGGSSMTDEQLETYLGITPDDAKYTVHKRPSAHKVAVLKRPNGEYYVVPINPKFYKVEDDLVEKRSQEVSTDRCSVQQAEHHAAAG